MSEMLHQPGGPEIYSGVGIPETEIHKIPDTGMKEVVEYSETEGYVSDEKLCQIMRMAHSEIGKILNSGKRLSYEKVQEAENKFLKRINKPNSDEELLAKVFFGNVLVSIKAAEIEKGANHKESNKFFKENIEQKHWIVKFVHKNQNNPEIIKEFWKEYESTYNELPEFQKERKYQNDRNRKNKYYSKEDTLKIDKSGILGEVAAMNLFDEISEKGKTKIEIEQASAEQDMNGIDFIVRFENKYGKSKIIIVQVKCVTKDRSNDENTVEFYSRFNLRDKNNSKNDKAQLLKKACFDYEREQRNSGEQSISVSGGLWIEFTKIRGSQIIDNRGRITNEKKKNLIKDQLKLQLELELELN